MANEPFKTAVSEPVTTTHPQVQPSGDNSVATPALTSNPNPSLDEYLTERGQPYSNEYFNTGTPYEYLPSDTQQHLESLDNYVKREIQDRHWLNSLSNYNRIMEEISFEMGLSDDTSSSERIERLGAYARSMLQLDGIDDVRQKLKRELRRVRNSKEARDLVLKEIGRKIL